MNLIKDHDFYIHIWNVFCQLCFIWSLCVSSAVAPFNYAHLSPKQMHRFLKAKNSKKTLHSGEEKGQFHFGGQGYHVHFARQYILQLDQYVCNTIFLMNPIWIIIVHFVYWLISNMFLFIFIVVTASVITTHWSLFLMR